MKQIAKNRPEHQLPISGRLAVPVFVAATMMLVCFRTSAYAWAPIATAGGGHEETVAVVAQGQIPTAVCGTWAMLQVSNLKALQSFRRTIDSALAIPGVKGLSIRVPWTNITSDLSIYDASLKITQADHSHLAIRFIGGIDTPSQFLGNSTLMLGRSIPLPWGAGSTATSFVPNKAFESGYDATVKQLAAYARKHGIHLLHLTWQGGPSDEIYRGTEVQIAPGYSLQNFLTGSKRLIAIGMSVAGPDLTVEWSLGGVGTGGVVVPLEAFMSTTYGSDNPKLIVQFNDLSDVLPDPTHPANGVNKERQMKGEGDFNWTNVYQTLVSEKSQTVEVYLQSFGASLAHAAALRKEVASFASC